MYIQKVRLQAGDRPKEKLHPTLPYNIAIDKHGEVGNDLESGQREHNTSAHIGPQPLEYLGWATALQVSDSSPVSQPCI